MALGSSAMLPLIGAGTADIGAMTAGMLAFETASQISSFMLSEKAMIGLIMKTAMDDAKSLFR